MSRQIVCLVVSIFMLGSGIGMAQQVERVAGYEWIPVPRDKIVKVSKEVLARPDIPFKAEEKIVRVQALRLDWDIAAMVYEPNDSSKIPIGADGKKAGILLLHGGSGDHRGKDKFARFLTSKFGFKVVNMSYPGRLNLQASDRDWPGDTIKPDGSVRTPIWKKDEVITRDQYDIVEDKEELRRRRWGTLILACAKEGTIFYDRMAGWPAAFEEGGKELARRFLPEGEFSVYAHGHSTGGPFTMMLSQRIPNMAGIIGMESSPFGHLYGEMLRKSQGLRETWAAPFNCLRIRSWRDTARYRGYEAIEEEGTDALARLAMLMEEVHESWARGTRQPQFKAENILHFDSPAGMEGAARAAAKRLDYGGPRTEALVEQYLGYLRELRGPDAKPVPPLILAIAQNSRDHTAESYRNVYLPMYAKMNPAPKLKLYQLGAGIHGYSAPEPGLPEGVAPFGVQMWYDAIVGGYYTGK